MAAIITEKFRTHNAKQFVEIVSESNSQAYTFIGRPNSWTDDASPPTPADNYNDEADAHRSMVALKKISSSDVSHAIVRRNWTSGTTYDEYRHNYTSSNTATSGATTLWDSLYYVVTDDYNVYKVISNNNGGASTVKPDHTTSADSAIPTESDGYRWKFMYSISASDVIKFVTNDFIPVKTIGAKQAVGGSSGAQGTAASDDGSAQYDVENAAVAGNLLLARVVSAGSGYTASTTTTGITIRGDGSSGQATVVTNGSGGVASVSITNAGSGYTTAFIANEDIPGFDNGDQAADGTNNSANIEFIISPTHGHGADPIEELGGNYVILNSRLEYSEGSGDFPTDNDFRQLGVIINPATNSSGTQLTATTAKAYKQMTFQASGFSAPAVDTVIRNASTEVVGTAVGLVVSVDSSNRVISYLPFPNESGNIVAFANGNTIFSSSSTNHGTLASSSAITAEEVQRHTGEIIYLENRTSVARASDQIEDIKLIVEM